MAKQAQGKSKSKPRSRKKTEATKSRPLRRLGVLALRGCAVLAVLVTVLVFLFAWVNPPVTYTMASELYRLGDLDRDWVEIEDIAPVMARSAVAAEDANFCRHWGFDVVALRQAIEGGGKRGGSTISQQVVKNVFLWQGRSWIRKALETAITPVVEIVWSKRRILEVYLNVAEMDEGVFGVAAAGRHYFGVEPDKLSARQAALLAAILPAPRLWSAAKPTSRIRNRAVRIADGAATIRADGRSDCFED